MPLPDNAMDRLKSAFVGTVATDLDARPALRVTDVTAAGVSAAPASPANWTDRSGTIAAGGAAQQAAAANPARVYLCIENLSTTEDLWFDLTATAVISQPSIRLAPGAAWENPSHFRPTGAVSVIAATTAHAFAAKEA